MMSGHQYAAEHVIRHWRRQELAAHIAPVENGLIDRSPVDI
jgi:hypothetical protein